MSFISFIAISLSLFFAKACYKCPGKLGNRHESYFLVTNIDSVIQQIKIRGGNNSVTYYGVYLIYAVRNDSLFKIVSTRTMAPRCKSIKVGGRYQFKLESYFAQQPSQLPNLGQAEPGGIILNGVLVEREEKFMYDIFHDERLENLCFKK